MRLFTACAIALGLNFVVNHNGFAQTKVPNKEPIPHGQSAPPGPALTPQEALKKMKVPPGFHVELVAAEPDIVNPVSMTFDDKGRIWITESIEYPRRSAGPGKDRVKILESTKGDGKFDKVTTVIDGLNIPSGIAVGHGGVWVANSPDILFYPFEDFAAPKLGKPQVVVSGFGRFDTHELPNSLTWGPDGWLYGLNGVFNQSHIKHQGKEFSFTCALFRIHPRTKAFEIFCEGTSNPWGLAFNENGDAFVSACVIDHLWHLTETGYYLRQGGPYPPFTWKIGSIVKHRHQQAAYCGLCWFDSDAYPPEYREKLYMGNIHGNCINSDELTRDGSTYFARPRPDFLSANDAWFMPVSQKVGPDGCMYILDWYDRYHCYQDANRDPAGIDRLHGRLYRVVYKEYKAAGTVDLSKESDDQLIQRLHGPNVHFRELAQRLLTERDNKESRAKLEKLSDDKNASRKTRLHALWALLGTGHFEGEYHHGVITSDDPIIRSWGIRALGSLTLLGALVYAIIPERVRFPDTTPDEKLQLAVAARKFPDDIRLRMLLGVLGSCGDDKLIPHIVWQNLHPLLEDRSEAFLQAVAKIDLEKAPRVAEMMPRVVDRILAVKKLPPGTLAGLIVHLSAAKGDRAACAECLAMLTQKVQSGELAGQQLASLSEQLKPSLNRMLDDPNRTFAVEAVLLLAAMKETDGISAVRIIFMNDKLGEVIRLRALKSLIKGGDGKDVLAVGETILRDKQGSVQFRGQFLAALGALDDPGVAGQVLRFYDKMEPGLQPKAIDLLTERVPWSKQLLGEIGAKKIPANVLNMNQVRKILATKDASLIKQVTDVWGTLRETRNPNREKIVAEMRDLAQKTPGDPKAGILIFKKLCAQCHKIYGEGVDVGPDITANGRSDFDQLLSNIFDPSLVIGAGYQAVTVNTKQGQVMSGLLVEDNPQRVVLKVQGGEMKTIARKDVDEQFTSKVSLMPEDVEKQLRPQEIVDLLSFLSLDRPPQDPMARKIPGTPR